MDVVTWNLNGLEPVDLGPRTEGALFTMLLGATLEEIVETGPTVEAPAVLLLQEVVDTSFHAHIAPHLKAAGYRLFPEQPPERSYFEVIAVRAPIQHASTERFARTGMGRALTRVEIPGLTLFTGHLESLGPGRPARLEQTAFVLDALASCDGPALFGGDTNLRKAEWSDVPVPPGITDAWEVLGSSKASANTWGRARYDRFWLKDLRPTSLSLVGAGPLPATGTPPSDHRGVRVSVEAKP